MSSYKGAPSPKDGPDGRPDYQVKPRLNLTFGVEFEFALAHLPTSTWQDLDPLDPRPVYGISRPLSTVKRTNLGLYDVEYYQYDEANAIQQHVADTIARQGLITLNAARNPEPTKAEKEVSWVVKDDISIKPLALHYRFRDIEVVSPPFYYSKKALHEVRIVCEDLPSQYRLAINTSCSVHVHVGNGVKGFSAQHLRNLMAMFWAFEPQLNTMHPSHRQDNNAYNGTLRKNSRLALELDMHMLTARDGLKRIFDTSKINDIIVLLTPDDGPYSPDGPSVLLYNISNLKEAAMFTNNPRFMLPEAEKFKKTIEFRHHEATFDVEAVNQWIRVCVRLVEFAEEVRPERLRAWLEEHIDTDYSVIQILEATKQPLAAWYYERKISERLRKSEALKDEDLVDNTKFRI